VLVIPAIDILGGRCVRLVRGDYSNPTVYSDDPADVAATFADAGAKRIHVVDLDGARDLGDNHTTIEAILRRKDVQVQVAPGLLPLGNRGRYSHRLRRRILARHSPASRCGHTLKTLTD